MSLLEELKDRADMLDAELLTLSSRMKEIARESEEIHTCINALDIAEMDAEDDGGTISLDRSDLTGHPNAPDEGGSSTASFDLDSLSPEERQEMIDRAVGDEAEQQRAVQAFEEQEGEDYEAVRDRAGEVEIPEGFTKWEGGACPVAKGTVIEALIRGDVIGIHMSHPKMNKPEYFASGCWEHIEGFDHIIAYRVLQSGEEGLTITQDAGGYAPVTEAVEENSVYGTDVAYADGVEARIQNIPIECNPGEGIDAVEWERGWKEADATITLN